MPNNPSALRGVMYAKLRHTKTTVVRALYAIMGARTVIDGRVFSDAVEVSRNSQRHIQNAVLPTLQTPIRYSPKNVLDGLG